MFPSSINVSILRVSFAAPVSTCFEQAGGCSSVTFSRLPETTTIDWGWLLHPIRKNSGDDFGMVYGIGFTTLNIYIYIIYIYIYTWIYTYVYCIHTYIYIFLWDTTNKRQKSESINFNCSERFESCKWTLFLYSRRHVQRSSTEFKRWTSWRTKVQTQAPSSGNVR